MASAAAGRACVGTWRSAALAGRVSPANSESRVLVGPRQGASRRQCCRAAGGPASPACSAGCLGAWPRLRRQRRRGRSLSAEGGGHPAHSAPTALFPGMENDDSAVQYAIGRSDTVAPGTGIDLEFDADVQTMSPEASEYETCYVTSHKGPCRVATYSRDGQLIATGSADASIKILDTERMLAKSAMPIEVSTVTAPSARGAARVVPCLCLVAGSGGWTKYLSGRVSYSNSSS